MVIIGLIVGGILTGQDLINAATIRAQVSQISEFTTAVNTFKMKYNYLPGDMPPSEASALGFFTFTGVAAGGYDIYNQYPYGNNDGTINFNSENLPFWSHLSDAKLIKGSYGGKAGKLLDPNTAHPNAGLLLPGVGVDSNGQCTTLSSCAKVLPPAKMGGGYASVVVWSNINSSIYTFSNTQKMNMFGIWDRVNFTRIFSAFEMYQIDNKMDDGLPATGNVRDHYTEDFGSGTFRLDNPSTFGLPCTKAGVAANHLDQTYDLTPATANAKNCEALDILF